ncbi:hypothetical protein [Nostoc sp. T09]|uniref:hypothetical protein n=1 Tax=Nostoc sp. T09 TaxID=1932621 RepID=UPI0015C4F3A6|nr:hypothetical protein [Nostoc sp. T09]
MRAIALLRDCENAAIAQPCRFCSNFLTCSWIAVSMMALQTSSDGIHQQIRLLA